MGSIKRRNGYTLIELSVVIALIGILMGTALSVGNIAVEKTNIVTTDTSLDDIEKAIQLFYNQNKRVPCPASPTQAENTANFGIEDNCSNAAPVLGGIVELNNGTADEQWIGALPTRSLGLPDKAMYDRWNNRLVYGVQKNFADSSKTFSTEVANSLATMIKIQDKSGNTINPNAVAADLQNPVVYVLLSEGKDKRGAYNKAGAQPVSCAATNTQMDVENCDFTVPATKDSIFVDTDLADSTTTSQYYYDRLRWKTKVNFGVLPNNQTYVLVKKNIGAGDGSVCFIASNGALKCSGADWNEQQGNGLAGDQTVFTSEITGFTDWNSVVADVSSTCGIRSGGRLYCWGRNDNGQVGNGTTGGDINIPTEVAGAYTDWTDIAVSYINACGIRLGRAYCWGGNGFGQIGNGSTGAPVAIPTEVSGGFTDWKYITAGDVMACGIRGSGKLYCWGYNNAGQVGDGTTINKSTPTEVSGLYSDWVHISTTASGMCGIRSSGRAYCWGSNSSGQLGIGSIIDSSVPVEVSGGFTDWTYIHYGYEMSCGIRAGLAYCWGDNGQGGLGTGSSGSDVKLPQLVGGGITDWKYIENDSGESACGVRASGQLYCWGTNQFGQFGNGGTSGSVVAPTLTASVTVKVN